MAREQTVEIPVGGMDCAERFEALPGQGRGYECGRWQPASARDATGVLAAEELEAAGKTILYVSVNGELAGVLAASNTVRDEVPEALRAVRTLGVEKIGLLRRGSSVPAEWIPVYAAMTGGRRE